MSGPILTTSETVEQMLEQTGTIFHPKQKSNSQALRYNEGKAKLSYLLSAPAALNGVSRVMDFGAQKYKRDNWLKGLPYTEIIDSTLRHMVSFINGEDDDPESHLPHVDHILCNALFLAQLYRSKPEFDDRSKGAK